MKKRTKVLLSIAIALVVLLVVAYFGVGYVIFEKLGNVTGSCDRHQANQPDKFEVAEWAVEEGWPAGFDVTPYFMSPYELVKFPSRDGKIQVAGGGSRPAKPRQARQP